MTSEAAPAFDEPVADPAIEDYAAIGNCKSLALVSCFGSIDWWCLPHFSGPSYFGALLDRERGGRFALTPRHIERVEQSYLEHSNVVRTRFHCIGGVLELTDFMTLAHGDAGDTLPMQPAHEIVRIARCVAGRVELQALYQPRPDYARGLPRLTQRGRLGWQCSFDGLSTQLHSRLEFKPQASATLQARVLLDAGEQCEASLSTCEREIGVILPIGSAAQQRLDETLAWWRGWCAHCAYGGPHREAVVRSALSLKLLSYAPSGAVVAAGTTSLPEALDCARNWDYRYCWLRDASLVLQAFIDLGFFEESACFLGWLLHATRLTQPRLQVMYDIYGETSLDERELPSLRGYHGVGPVRVGNAASRQLQLDVYGEVILTAFEFVERGGALGAAEKASLAGFVDRVCSCWREPDQGVWEIRGPRRHNTYSKLMCWAALDRALRLHERGALALDAAHLRRECAALRTDIDAHGYDEALGAYVGTYVGSDGGSAPDASLLQMARLGYLDANDPKMLRTVRLISERLSVKGLLYRYPPGGAYDGVGGPDNLFTLCSFWWVELLALQGRIGEADAMMRRLLALRNAVGLYAEEFDARTLQPLGNFPQAFSHVGLITAALALERASRARRHKP
jgi:GH15 family glucan-1,4-alpha-glucosidase